MSAPVLDFPPFPAAYPSRQSIFECLDDPRATAALPSLGSILRELNQLATSGSAHLEEITRLVRLDQSLSLRVLRIANSAYFAPACPIADVPAALLYVGLSTVRDALVSSRCLERTCHIRQDVFDWKQFWIHAAAVGHLTTELARHLPEPTLAPEVFFLMGQFHDVGKVVLACLMPEAFAEIYTRAAAERRPPAALELELLGVEHGHLGAWYMEKQGIPLMLREPVRFHHGLMPADQRPFLHAMLIRLADHLAHDAGIGRSGNGAELGRPYASPEWEAYVTHCQMTGTAAAQLQAELEAQVQRIGALVREIIN